MTFSLNKMNEDCNIQSVFTEQLLLVFSAEYKSFSVLLGNWLMDSEQPLCGVQTSASSLGDVFFSHNWTWLCLVNFIHRHSFSVYLLKVKNYALILSIFAFYMHVFPCVLKSVNSKFNSIISPCMELIWVRNAKFTRWFQRQQRWNCVSSSEWLWMSFLLNAGAWLALLSSVDSNC